MQVIAYAGDKKLAASGLVTLKPELNTFTLKIDTLSYEFRFIPKSDEAVTGVLSNDGTNSVNVIAEAAPPVSQVYNIPGAAKIDNISYDLWLQVQYFGKPESVIRVISYSLAEA